MNRVADDADLWKVAGEVIDKLAAGPTRAFAIAKENLNNAMLGLLYRQLELERSGMIRAARVRRLPRRARGILRKTHGQLHGKVKEVSE